MLADESAESLAAGVAQWEVRAEFRSHHEAAALAGKLRMERREAPADATVRAQHSPAYLPFTGF